ncbi:MAG: PAS domain S-box protein [Pseudomonadota bacterium]
MNLDVLLNNILTSGIKFSDPETIRKIKILNIFQLVFIMTAPLLGLFYFYIGAILLFYVAIIAGLLMVTSLLLLRKTKNLLWSGNVALLVVWAALLILSWNSGAVTFDGVIRPAWLLNAGLVLFAIFLNGYLWGTVWTTVVFLETGLVIYLFRTGYLFPNLIPQEISTVYSLGSFLVCLLAILLVAFLFEKEKIEALQREEGKSHALRESKRYIDDILERSPIPTFILDRNHRVIQWNHACHEITGVSAEEALGKRVWEGLKVDARGSIADIILEDPGAISESFEDAIVSKTDTGWFELKMFLSKLGNGMRAVVTAAPILDNNGTVRGAIQTIQEIKAPHHEAGQIGGLDDLASLPVFKLDTQGKITFWNHACEESFGHVSPDVLGKNVLSLLSKRYRPGFRDLIARVLKGESPPERPLKFYKNDGKPAYVLARAYAAQSEEVEGRECMILCTDITDLSIRNKKLELYALESKEKLKTLSEEHDLLKKNIATFIRKKDDTKKEDAE